MLILLDSGSSHCFLDKRIAKCVKGMTYQTKLLTVMVANGQTMTSSEECRGVLWSMHKYKFVHNFLIIELGGYDIIIGVDWMK